MSENNKNGFIDFNQNLAAFNLEVLNQNLVQLNKLSYSHRGVSSVLSSHCYLVRIA